MHFNQIRKIFVRTVYILVFFYVSSPIVHPEKLYENVNVLLFTIDSLRHDHLGCYGYEKNITPALDKLAKTAVVFSQAIAQSAWTSPCLISIFTALYPHSHNVDASGKSIENNITALPEILKKYGYISPAFSYLIRDPNFFHLGFERAPEHIYEGSSLDDLFELLKIYKDEKFFIWYHDKTIHLPYKPSFPYDQLLTHMQEDEDSKMSSGLFAVKNNVIIKNGTVEFKKEDRKEIIDLYDANIKRLDDHISFLIMKLEELELLDNTLIIITADHGEELLDHGFVGHASTSLNAKLYDEIVHIPLIFSLPGYLSSKSIDAQVQQIDIMPTLLDFLNIPIPSNLEGRSLVPLIQDQRQEWPEYALSETNMGGYQSTEEMKKILLTSLRTSEWKLIRRKNKEDIKYELYHLEKDPEEKKDVFQDYPEIFKNLNSEMRKLTDL